MFCLTQGTTFGGGLQSSVSALPVTAGLCIVTETCARRCSPARTPQLGMEQSCHPAPLGRPGQLHGPRPSPSSTALSLGESPVDGTARNSSRLRAANTRSLFLRGVPGRCAAIVPGVGDTVLCRVWANMSGAALSPPVQAFV